MQPPTIDDIRAAAQRIEGAVIHPRVDWNHSYYGSNNATAKGVVLEGKYFNPQADPLREALSALN